jgi:Transcriptional regulatory protein, C terminal
MYFRPARTLSPREVVARVRAVLRRTEAARAQPDIVRVGEAIVLDTARVEASVDGRLVDLTPTEFQLLLHMTRQPGRAVTRAQLLDALHGVAVESYERAIDAHVKTCAARSSATRTPPSPADRVRGRLPHRRRLDVTRRPGAQRWRPDGGGRQHPRPQWREPSLRRAET